MTKSFNRWVMGSLAVSLFALTLSIAADDNSPGSAWKTDLLTWRAQQAKEIPGGTGSQATADQLDGLKEAVAGARARVQATPRLASLIAAMARP